MATLALDTSTVVATAAVVSGESILAEVVWTIPRSHSEKILPAIDAVIKQADLQPADIDVIAVTTGPGSFTGLRIGMSLAKGLADGLGAQIKGISTLRLLAEQVKLHRGVIIPALCAQRGQYYAGLFISDGVSVRRLVPDSVVDPEEIEHWISTHKDEPLITGEGAPEIGQLYSVAVAAPESRLPRAGLLGLIAGAEAPISSGNLLPNYVRKSSARSKRGIS